MATYAISFEIKSDSTYSKRYQSLMAQVHKCSIVWTETTSFALVQTPESLEDLELRLFVQSEISHLRDKLLVINVTNIPGIFRGVNEMPATLARLMPLVTQTIPQS